LFVPAAGAAVAGAAVAPKENPVEGDAAGAPKLKPPVHSRVTKTSLKAHLQGQPRELQTIDLLQANSHKSRRF